MTISLNSLRRNLCILLLSTGLLSPQAVWAHGVGGGGMPHIGHSPINSFPRAMSGPLGHGGFAGHGANAIARNSRSGPVSVISKPSLPIAGSAGIAGAGGSATKVTPTANKLSAQNMLAQTAAQGNATVYPSNGAVGSNTLSINGLNSKVAQLANAGSSGSTKLPDKSAVSALNSAAAAGKPRELDIFQDISNAGTSALNAVGTAVGQTEQAVGSAASSVAQAASGIFGGNQASGSVFPTAGSSSAGGSGIGGVVGGFNMGIAGVSGSAIGKIKPSSTNLATQLVNQTAKLPSAGAGSASTGSSGIKIPTQPIVLPQSQNPVANQSGGATGAPGATNPAPGSSGPMNGGGPVFAGGGSGSSGASSGGLGLGLGGGVLSNVLGSLGGLGFGGYGGGSYGGSGYSGGAYLGSGYASPAGYVDSGVASGTTDVASNLPSPSLVAPAVQPAAATSPAIASSIDLVLEDVTLVQKATLAAGPAYRVQFRNQGTDAAGKFVVGILALIDGVSPSDAPHALVEVPGLAAGDVATVTLRLPQAATRLVSVSHATPTMFTKLAVAIDVDNRVSETDKSNNGVVIDRTSLESAVK